MKDTSQRLIGYRIKAAREAKNWTQTQLSNALEFNDRQSISDIETGKRALKPDELVTLTEVLDRDIEFFIDPFCVAGEAQFSWRASSKIEEKNLNDFEITAGKWIGLLRWLRANKQDFANPLKHSLRLTKQSSYEDAIKCAESLVKKMNLGKIPADHLIDLIETKLDIPVLFVDTIKTPEGYSVSGASCHLQDFGVILINRNEPETRCFYDLAHELFHILTWDAMRPEHRESNSYEDRTKEKKIEQLADNFAAALLMPKSSLESLIEPSRLDDISYLVKMASTFKVSPIALAWRLFNLKWIDKKTVDLMKGKHLHSSFTPKLFSTNFIKLLYDSIEHGKLSARKAAKALSMNLTQLKELFSEYSLSAPFDL